MVTPRDPEVCPRRIGMSVSTTSPPVPSLPYSSVPSDLYPSLWFWSLFLGFVSDKWSFTSPKLKVGLGGKFRGPSSFQKHLRKGRDPGTRVGFPRGNTQTKFPVEALFPNCGRATILVTDAFLASVVRILMAP